MLKKADTPVTEILAYFRNCNLSGKLEVFSKMKVCLGKPGWEFIPFGSRRVVCFPPGNRDAVEYLPWVGYVENGIVTLHSVVNTGLRASVAQSEAAEDEGDATEEMEMEHEEVEEVQTDPVIAENYFDPWEDDIRNTFAYL